MTSSTFLQADDELFCCEQLEGLVSLVCVCLMCVFVIIIM